MRETKLTTLANARVKATKNGEIDVSGYAAVFGNLDSYSDVIQKGAFSRTLAEQGPTRVTLRGHDVDRVIGVGSFVEDNYGLFGKYRFVAGVKDAEETLALVRASALTGISIGYSVPANGYSYKNGNRILTDLDLFETSFVTFPANDLARVTGADEKALRALNEAVTNNMTALAIEQAFATITNELKTGR
jgi:Escherichia/Staphylococcus phage prohead protease